MLPVLVCAVIFVMSGVLGAECSAEEDYGYFGALEDHQDALSGEQAQELLDLLDSTAREIHANVGVILGNASLDGLSERSYAKEFHNRSFGEESNSIVLMLVKTGSHKQAQIYSSEPDKQQLLRRKPPQRRRRSPQRRRRRKAQIKQSTPACP